MSISNALRTHYGTRIPTALASLTNLQSINFNGVGLTGPIPNMPQLSRLTYLSIASNALTGALPSFLARNGQSSNVNLYGSSNCNLTSDASFKGLSVDLNSQGYCAGNAGKHPFSQ